MHRYGKCSICGEKEALIFVRVYTGGSFEEKALCASCAIKYLEGKEEVKSLSFVDEKLMGFVHEMRDLMTDLVTDITSFINTIQYTDEKTKEIKCPVCGLSYNDFKEKGYLGCSACYGSFSESINEFVFEMERGYSHKGKVPKRFDELLSLKKEIYDIKCEIDRSIQTENYEKVMKLSNRLKKLIGGYRIGKDYEIY